MPSVGAKDALRTLIVEDSDDDCELLLRQLSRAYVVTHRRVQNAEAMRAALAEEPWDLVLSDYVMPDFGGPEALQVMNESGLDVPFLVLSGTIGEETAVELLKAGAHDFVMKGRLARLLPAIARELREAKNRKSRREAIALVEESERRLSAMFHQVAIGIVETDLEGRVQTANERFCDLVGRRLEQLVGLSLVDITHADDRAATSAALLRLAGGEHNAVLEKRYLRPDGSHVWVGDTTSVVSADDGRPRYTVAMVQDITQRKRVEEELRQAVRARDEFLSLASHELRTPVTTLGLQVETSLRLIHSEQDPATAIRKIDSRLEGAARQLDRLTVLIGTLLDVTRITSGRFTISRREVDLARVVEAVVARSQTALQRSGSRLTRSGDPHVTGAWDSSALEAAVGNLLSNALKFGEGRPIEITIAKAADRARLVVADQGIGIALDEQARIFERFERAVPMERYGGVGIGLWVVRHVVEAHGGTIRVESRPGAGSTFSVELPLDVPAGGVLESPSP